MNGSRNDGKESEKFGDQSRASDCVNEKSGSSSEVRHESIAGECTGVSHIIENLDTATASPPDLNLLATFGDDSLSSPEESFHDSLGDIGLSSNGNSITIYGGLFGNGIEIPNAVDLTSYKESEMSTPISEDFAAIGSLVTPLSSVPASTSNATAPARDHSPGATILPTSTGLCATLDGPDIPPAALQCSESSFGVGGFPDVFGHGGCSSSPLDVHVHSLKPEKVNPCPSQTNNFQPPFATFGVAPGGSQYQEFPSSYQNQLAPPISQQGTANNYTWTCINNPLMAVTADCPTRNTYGVPSCAFIDPTLNNSQGIGNYGGAQGMDSYHKALSMDVAADHPADQGIECGDGTLYSAIGPPPPIEHYGQASTTALNRSYSSNSSRMLWSGCAYGHSQLAYNNHATYSTCAVNAFGRQEAVQQRFGQVDTLFNTMATSGKTVHFQTTPPIAFTSPPVPPVFQDVNAFASEPFFAHQLPSATLTSPGVVIANTFNPPRPYSVIYGAPHTAVEGAEKALDMSFKQNLPSARSQSVIEVGSVNVSHLPELPSASQGSGFQGQLMDTVFRDATDAVPTEKANQGFVCAICCPIIAGGVRRAAATSGSGFRNGKVVGEGRGPAFSGGPKVSFETPPRRRVPEEGSVPHKRYLTVREMLIERAKVRMTQIASTTPEQPETASGGPGEPCRSAPPPPPPPAVFLPRSCSTGPMDGAVPQVRSVPGTSVLKSQVFKQGPGHVLEPPNILSAGSVAARDFPVSVAVALPSTSEPCLNFNQAAVVPHARRLVPLGPRMPAPALVDAARPQDSLPLLKKLITASPATFRQLRAKLYGQGPNSNVPSTISGDPFSVSSNPSAATATAAVPLLLSSQTNVAPAYITIPESYKPGMPMECSPDCSSYCEARAPSLPRHYDLEQLQIGTFRVKKTVAPGAKNVNKLKVLFLKKKFVYEFLVGVDNIVSPPKSVSRMAMIEVPFSIVTAVHCNEEEVLIAVSATPTLFLGCRQARGGPNSNFVYFDRSCPSDITDGQLEKNRLHKIVLKKRHVENLRSSLENFDVRFILILRSPIFEAANKNDEIASPGCHRLQTSDAGANRDADGLSEVSIARKRSAPRVQNPLHESAKKSAIYIMCHCQVSCRSNRCSCMKSKSKCGTGPSGCMCKACDNPLNLLSDLGIDLCKAMDDPCLIQSIVTYKGDLKKLLERMVTFSCCGTSVLVRDSIPGVTTCTNVSCKWQRSFKFSWCQLKLFDEELCPRNHCSACRSCKDSLDLHCQACRKCNPVDGSSAKCRFCGASRDVSFTEHSSVSIVLKRYRLNKNRISSDLPLHSSETAAGKCLSKPSDNIQNKSDSESSVVFEEAKEIFALQCVNADKEDFVSENRESQIDC